MPERLVNQQKPLVLSQEPRLEMPQPEGGKRRKQRLLKGQRTSLTIHDFFQRYFLGKTVFKITLQPKPQVGRHGGSTGEGRPGVSGVMAKSRAPLPPSSAVSPAPHLLLSISALRIASFYTSRPLRQNF